MIKTVTDAWLKSKGMLIDIHKAVLEAAWKYGETEELFPKEERLEFTTKEIIVVSVRCVIAFLCLIGTILVIVVTARSRQQRYKSWRLYILTSLLVLAWMCMSLYRGIYKQNCTILDEECLLELYIQKLM